MSDDDLWEMVNLVPRLTRLPMTVWAWPKGSARHDCLDRGIRRRTCPGCVLAGHLEH